MAGTGARDVVSTCDFKRDVWKHKLCSKLWSLQECVRANDASRKNLSAAVWSRHLESGPGTSGSCASWVMLVFSIRETLTFAKKNTRLA